MSKHKDSDVKIDFKYDYKYYLTDKDSFLCSKYFKVLEKEIKKCFHFMNETNHPPKVLSKLTSKFEYLATFPTKGVQGIVGLLLCNSINKYPVVFKIPVEIDKMIEHEHLILESLNTIRDFCPHFVGSLGMFKLPISRTYVYDQIEDDDDDDDDNSKNSRSQLSKRSQSSSEIEEEEEEEFEDDFGETNLFTIEDDYLPTNTLLLEYVSDISFADMCNKSVKNKSLIVSQVLMILCAIKIAQLHVNFTHYDLHIDNILIRQCEPEAMFIYKINGSVINVPTFGFYPVIIDMGSSYSNALENNDMKSSIANYDNGLQPTIYDPLNDLHHFLISALYDIEYDSEEYYFLST